ncbi:MAG: dihydropteroate synthase [Paracoccus sp. (in: a-proteobacteria)]|nr:dihydropteroate synthase [Paracoccus sp. (in: a-proteobacteria)]
MSRDYFRPIPQEGGALPIAGGWVRFSSVEVLARGAAPRVIDAADAPREWRDRVCARRADLAGLAMDRAQIMGIVNATPDSFSDGGRWGDGAAHGRALFAQGAAIVDVGGESTRPGAAEVPISDEIERVLPAVRALSALGPVSIDTRKAGVARAALEAGAGLVNDVSGLDFDADMAGVVARSGAALCLMHAQGLPADMQDDPQYGDVLLDVYDALEARIARACAAGISRDRIAIDPGIGFGKTLAHNLAILRRISLFHGLGCPILLGVSRKRFIGAISGAEQADARDPGSLAVTLAAVAQGVQIHRVHEVAGAAQGLALWHAVRDGINQEART